MAELTRQKKSDSSCQRKSKFKYSFSKLTKHKYFNSLELGQTHLLTSHWTGLRLKRRCGWWLRRWGCLCRWSCCAFCGYRRWGSLYFKPHVIRDYRESKPINPAKFNLQGHYKYKSYEWFDLFGHICFKQGHRRWRYHCILLDSGRQGCLICAILPSGMGARGVSSEHVEHKEMFSCSPT